MALEDRDIFAAICSRCSDQPIEFIMEQYEKAKRINMDIEKRIDNGDTVEESPECALTAAEIIEKVESPKKKYTRRKLKVKPQDSITDDAIFCCICGEERQSLTQKHLACHDISVEDYKKLCGYSPDQPLMSNRRLARSREIIGRAQKARIDKRRAQAE